MRAEQIDERSLERERVGGNFVVFVYEGGDEPGRSWSVDSYLLADADMSEVLRWLGDNLPTDSCWALGIVQEPDEPTAESDLAVSWIVGADVLNLRPSIREPLERDLAVDMLARRHRVTLP